MPEAGYALSTITAGAEIGLQPRPFLG